MKIIKSGHDKSWICHLRAETYKTKINKIKMFKLKRNKFLDVLIDLIAKTEINS